MDRALPLAGKEAAGARRPRPWSLLTTALFIALCCASVLLMTGFSLGSWLQQQNSGAVSTHGGGMDDHGPPPPLMDQHSDAPDDHHDDPPEDDHDAAGAQHTDVSDDHDTPEAQHTDSPEAQHSDAPDDHHDAPEAQHTDAPQDDHDDAEEDDSSEVSVEVDPPVLLPYQRRKLAPPEQFTLSKTLDASTTREYTFNVTRDLAMPDAFNKSMILINGQSPGPLIEANTGDTIRVVVNNMMANESTTIHWHGIDQNNTSWMDGVHGISQCGIPPGESFTYEFTVINQRGTFWYHSHLSLQNAEGLYGPLIIHDAEEKVPSVDQEHIIMMSDLYRHPGEELLSQYLSSKSPWSPRMAGMEPPADSITINGQHAYRCDEATGAHGRHGDEDDHQDEDELQTCLANSAYSMTVQRGIQARLRLINSATFLPFWFSVDNHTLQVVEMDGVEIEPIKATRVFLNPGQRYSVILTADSKRGRYHMRAAAAKGCFMGKSPQDSDIVKDNYEAVEILAYDGMRPDTPVIGAPWGDDEEPAPWHRHCRDMPFDMPKPLRVVDAYDVGPRNHHYFKYKMRLEGGSYRTFINKTSYATLPDSAALWGVQSENFSSTLEAADLAAYDFGPQQQVLVSLDEDMGAQIVINSLEHMAHPWHLHGQAFQVVGWGKGKYGAASSKTHWKLDNPMRRDTVTVPGASHLIIRVPGDNPGIWALHCHLLWHAHGGMFVALGQRLGKLHDMIEELGSASEGESLVRKFCAAKGS